MEQEHSYSIGFFVRGKYHLLCREGTAYRFRVIEKGGDDEPATFDYIDARRFIETHPICANISRTDIRLMTDDEVHNILEGINPPSRVKSLDLSGEEEDEEPLH